MVVLVVDDEPLQRDILRTIFTGEGYETLTAGSGHEALDIIRRTCPDVVFTDLKMEGMDGIEFLEAAQMESCKPSFIIMTAYGTIASAVEAVRKGAFDYITKPLDKDTLLITLKRAMERSMLLKENSLMQRELYGRFAIEGIAGTSERMRQIVEMIKKVAPSNVTVLIQGESGTGKELVARALHYSTARRTRPFTALNCASIPENLFESELFGYEAGAFTGAVSRKEGLFEATDGGTLFLDEIGDLPLAMQSKLLRVIQDKEVRRIGGTASVRVNVRLVAASNKNLEDEIGRGTFREDLYYRLRTVIIKLPPLRERLEDIPELVQLFLKKFNREMGKRVRNIEASAMKVLSGYHWPGNIRELESVIERSVLMDETGEILTADIEGAIGRKKPLALQGRTSLDIPDEGLDLEMLERELIKKALEKSGGVASKAARLLGLSYKTFLYRLEKMKAEEHTSG